VLAPSLPATAVALPKCPTFKNNKNNRNGAALISRIPILGTSKTYAINPKAGDDIWAAVVNLCQLMSEFLAMPSCGAKNMQ
jgi:hypothetical protein